MEAADDICYSVIDLEDAVEMGIISIGEFSSIFKFITKNTPIGNLEDNQYCALIRSKFIWNCIDFASNEFIDNYKEIMSGTFSKKDFFKDSSNEVAITLKESKDYAFKRIFNHKNKVKKEIGAYPCLHHLLDLFIPTIDSLYKNKGNINKLSNKEQTILNLLDRTPSVEIGKYQSYLEILDFIGGMTDNYATNLATETSGFSKI